MALRDYSDDPDFYDQGFEKEGVVSIWIGLLDGATNWDADVLQDLCGVGYYRLYNQECNNFDFEMVAIEKLLSELSYSKSFVSDVVRSVDKLNLEKGRWILAQYDFDYKPSKITRPISPDPIFIGSFKYTRDD